MGLDRSLLEIAKLLLSEHDTDRTAEIVLDRVLEATGVERGFIVVREGEGYTQRFDVHFDRDEVSNETRRFSRSLVRRAIETGQIVELRDVLQDQQLVAAESVQEIQGSSVLAAPLRAGSEVYGVVYLLSRQRPDGFSAEDRAFLTEFAEFAGLSLRRALEREQIEQRRRDLERDLFARHSFQGIVTRDPKMLALLETVAQVADSASTILIRHWRELSVRLAPGGVRVRYSGAAWCYGRGRTRRKGLMTRKLQIMRLHRRHRVSGFKRHSVVPHSAGPEARWRAGAT
jgi:transcriptional regulator with GAF, ATPase, and Fis domain